jgi:hypothetical protein
MRRMLPGHGRSDFLRSNSKGSERSEELKRFKLLLRGVRFIEPR